MRFFLITIFTSCLFLQSYAQIDPELLSSKGKLRDSLAMNLDAIHNRPLVKAGRLPVAIGGYMEANYQYLGENGISEGHQFQMRRVSLFAS